MSSPITSSDFENQTPGQALCDAFQEKLLNNSKIRQLLDYLFQDDNGKFNTGFIGDMLAVLQPISTLINVPQALDPSIASPTDGSVWLECNGQKVLQADYARLFAIFGTTYNQAGDNAATEFRVPDFSDQFALTRGTDFGIGTTGGEESHVLTAGEMPPHQHFTENNDTIATGDAGDNVLTNTNYVAKKADNGHDNPDYAIRGTNTLPSIAPTSVTGGAISVDDDATAFPQYADKYKAAAHNNMPPYRTVVTYTLAGYKVNGVMV